MNSVRVDKQTNKLAQLLKSRQMAQAVEKHPDKAAFAKFLIAVSRFVSDSSPKPIAEVKKELKEAIVMLCGTQNQPVRAQDLVADHEIVDEGE